MTGTAENRNEAIVIGASGGIGAALADALDRDAGFDAVHRLSRSATGFDITCEETIAAAAAGLKAEGVEARLVILASGILQDGQAKAEKSLRELEPPAMQHMFMVNSIGPALVMKHFLPLLPRKGRAVFAVLSARVGSIGDNRLGGWYSYRASKAALNQLVRTGAVELRRRAPEAICVALHPGTVDTSLTRAFAKSGLEVQPPPVAAERIMQVLSRLSPAQSSEFFDHHGRRIEW